MNALVMMVLVIDLNVADKYNVPKDRIVVHPLNLYFLDIRQYTIYPDNVCSTGHEVETLGAT